MVQPMSRRQVLAGVSGAVLARVARADEAIRRALNDFEVTHRELVVPGLDSAHEGLRVAQLSDIHIGVGTPDGRIVAAVATVNATRPDLVVLTGDFVTHSRRAISHIPELLRGIEPPAIAVLGNHDHWTDSRAVRRAVERCGYAVLQNQHTVLPLKGAPLAVLGVDDSHTRNDDVDATFKGVSEVGSRLVLAHNPPTADKLPSQAGLVCLSGHTHGGQVVVGRVTDAIFGCAGQPYVRGLYVVRGNQLYVNRGLGLGRGGPLPRVGSVPEVSVFTLRMA